MAENNINAYCKVCGAGYHVCNSCLSQKSFRPWRTIADSIDHFRIYTAIHGYTVSQNKAEAKDKLMQCDLSRLEDFKPEIKSIIEEIMDDSTGAENLKTEIIGE